MEGERKERKITLMTDGKMRQKKATTKRRVKLATETGNKQNMRSLGCSSNINTHL